MRLRNLMVLVSMSVMTALMSPAAPAQQQAAVANPLPADDVKVLVQQYQEELMAKTLYEAFHAEWGLQPFANIAARGETHHMQAVMAQLEVAGQAALVANVEKGVFADEKMQEMYDRLLAQGTASLEGAVKAGIEFEEFDIVDLRKVQEQTSVPQLRQMYAMLERGSHHHLQAFHRQAEMRGISYEPKVMTKEQFTAALAGTTPPQVPGAGAGPGPAAGCCGRCMVDPPQASTPSTTDDSEAATATSVAPPRRGQMAGQRMGAGMGRRAGAPN